jgi:hypothetical protein
MDLYSESGDSFSTGVSITNARNDAGVVTIGGIIYVSGGVDSVDYYRHEAYSSGSWSTKANVPQIAVTPRSRAHHAALSIGGYEILLGGSGDQAGAPETGRADRYDIGADSWSGRATNATAPRGDTCGFVSGGKGYQASGRASWLATAYYGNMSEFDDSSNTWTAKATSSTTRGYVGAFTNGSDGFVSAGYNGSYLTLLEKFTPGTNSYTTMTGIPTANGFCAVTNGTSAAFSMGGLNSLKANYSYVPDAWTTKTNLSANHYSGGSTLA